MSLYYMHRNILGFLLTCMLCLASTQNLSAQNCNLTDSLPFKTSTDYLMIWNGNKYVPFFVKGVNLGIAVPGTTPGDLQASFADYKRWFTKIKDMGFNCIRIYTLHYPDFYEAIVSYNKENPQQPLYFFQGIWLEEEMPGYSNNPDLFTLTGEFSNRIKETMDCMYGNRTVGQRFGQAFGKYETDASPWLIGYIIGREVHTEEVLHTNEKNKGVNAYEGTYLSIRNADPAEAWFTNRIDELLVHEQTNYKKQHPVSMSSWPTLDPLYHANELNRMEDSATIDLTKMDISKAKAGIFASYHAYPYYPDFISKEPKYQPYKDNYGQNSYLGYLTDMKKHYSKFPLIIAEFGTPSSWGIAHFAQSGMHHGGRDEIEQGEDAMRMFHNIRNAKCGGGIYFAFMDEWFKRTWIIDNLDYNIERRKLWHNVTSAEQNFGLIRFRKKGFQPARWADFCNTCAVTSIDAGADYDYLHLNLNLQKPLDQPDTVWISLDTYAAGLGESILPNGKRVNNRAEFCLMITNYTAELYVTEAYDIFAIWHKESGPEQLYHSIPTDGAPWKIVRWKNNYPVEDVQYIGKLKVKRSDQPILSNDAVIIDNSKITVRIPWSLINVVDPSSLTVFNDYRNTKRVEDTLSDGVSVTAFHNGFEATPTSRFVWNKWGNVVLNTDVEEVDKLGAGIMKYRLPELANPPIARCDFYNVNDGYIKVTANEGILKNDMNLDGPTMEAIIYETPLKGKLNLKKDGSFTYTAFDGQTGNDYFTYRVQGYNETSDPVYVKLFIDSIGVDPNPDPNNYLLSIYPNPALTTLNIESGLPISSMSLFTVLGQTVIETEVGANKKSLDVSKLRPGVYLLRVAHGEVSRTRKIIIGNK